jgi:hypothetical protein
MENFFALLIQWKHGLYGTVGMSEVPPQVVAARAEEAAALPALQAPAVVGALRAAREQEEGGGGSMTAHEAHIAQILAGKAMTVWISVWARPTFVDALTRAEDGAARAKVWNDVASMMGIKLTDEDHAELETMWNA